jgi:hypothetical protein
MPDKAIMTYKVARTLCKRAAAMCGTNERDEWNSYSELYTSDAQAALKACGAFDLLDALLNALPYVEDVLADKAQLACFKPGVVQAHAKAIRAAVAKATGAQA